LIAIGIDDLLEVTLGIEKTNPDKRQSQVAGFFSMIAGEYPQTTGVNGQTFVQAKLRRKVGDGFIYFVGIGLFEPGLIEYVVFVKAGQNVVVGANKFGVVGCFIQRELAHLAQK